MANLIVAIHNAFLDNSTLQNIKQVLTEKGVTTDVLVDEVYNHCHEKSLKETLHCIKHNNHWNSEDVEANSLMDLIQDFTLILDIEDIASFSNSNDYVCSLGHFQNYQFIYFPDLNDKRELAFTEVDNEHDVTKATMEEIYNMLKSACFEKPFDNPFAMFDNCRCNILRTVSLKKKIYQNKI